MFMIERVNHLQCQSNADIFVVGPQRRSDHKEPLHGLPAKAQAQVPEERDLEGFRFSPLSHHRIF